MCVYLDNIVYDAAIEKYSNALSSVMKFEKIKISTKDSFGFILAEPVFATASSPNFTASAMDGIAVDYKITLEASESNQLTLIKDVDYSVVDTGDYIEPKYNAVIMVEDLINIKDNQNAVKISKPIGFFENVRSTGEDIVKTQMILPSFHKIRPVDVGSLLAGGVEFVYVLKPFKVGIMPTGTEIVDVSKSELQKGDIIDSNSYMLKALVEEMGFKGVVNEIVEDNYDLLKENITKLTEENDIVLINAGSSAGREDFTKDILAELGEVLVHGVAIKPGKPVILAIVNNKMVVGIPGYPVASYIVFDKIIRPIINNLLKAKNSKTTLKCTLTKRINSSLKHLEFVRVKVGYVNNKWVATPLARGAGVSMSLVECDGILEVPKEYEGYNTGEEVEVILTKSLKEIENQIVVIGSHDLMLDFINDIMISEKEDTSISSTHLGSFGGILTLKNKESLIAPIHVLDEVTGEYNISTVSKFFKGEEMALIKGVQRQQGLIVKKGNPLNIKTILDIKECKYVNRQRGSGTYILLEHLMKEANIAKEDIVGFDFNVPTHFDVAINVKEGIADCGLGVYSVAKALDLDFIKLTNEEYDFLVHKEELESEKVQLFIETLKSENLRHKLEKSGGYEFNNTGEVILFEG